MSRSPGRLEELFLEPFFAETKMDLYEELFLEPYYDELFTADDIKLEIKIDDGCWSRVLGDPIQRGRSEVLWRLEIHPCQVDNNNIGQ